MSDQHNARVRQRLLKRIVIDEAGCWIWQGPQSSDGYGRYNVPGTGQLAHRVAYIVITGPIPEGLTLDHLCRNKLCVNPAHLEPVTRAENIMRGNGPCAQKARQTHCKRGHEFTPENTFRSTSGGRGCRTCRREAGKRRYAEGKQA